MSPLTALVLGAVSVLTPPSSEYCDQLPTANADGANLRVSAAAFPTANCGKYVVHCDGIDDREFYTVELPAQGMEHGVVASLSGHGGSNFHTQSLVDYAAAGLRSVAWAYEMDAGYEPWLCARAGCPQYADPAEAGPLQAACRQATITAYFEHEGEPLCVQAHSTGTAGATYAMLHYGLRPKYAQLTAFMPATNMACGLDGSRSECGGTPTRSWAGIHPDGSSQTVTGRYYAYWRAGNGDDYAIETFSLALGLPPGTGNKGTHLTAEQAARATAQSVITGADWDLGATVVDHYACLSSASVTDGQASLGYLSSLQAANPGRVFALGLPQSGGFDAFMDALFGWAGHRTVQQCTGEGVWKESNGQPSPIAQLMVDRMVELCR